MARKLKVFQSRFGFFDAVVAVPSQAAALRAWGTTQNLFAEKQAWTTGEPGAVAAAEAQPGVVLRRPVGTNEPFSLTPRLPRAADLPDVAAAPAPARAKPAPGGRKGKGRAAPKPPPPDRSALRAAEAALARLDEARTAEEGALERRRKALEREIATARSTYRAARTEAEAALAKAEAAFRKAGGVL